MNNSLSSQKLEVKYAGVAIEYGTLAMLLNSLLGERVLVMPLERSGQQRSQIRHQWIIHITGRRGMIGPVSFASFRAAEVIERSVGPTLAFPDLEDRLSHPMRRAQQFQEQLFTCVTTLLAQSPHIGQVVAPSRYCLPDEWIWSARCTDEHIAFRDGAWTLVGEVPHA